MSNSLSRFKPARRGVLQFALAGLCAAVALTICVPFADAQVPALPKSPVTINVVDVAGNSR